MTSHTGVVRGAGENHHEALERLGAALNGVRRAVASGPQSSLDLECAEHPIGLAKVLACEAVDSYALDHDGERAAVKDVAALLSLEQSTASRLLGECEAEGLLARLPHPTDGRRTSLVLTEVGVAVVREAGRTRTAFLAALLADWPQSDVAELAVLLERFAGAWRTRRSLADATLSGRHCPGSA